MLVYIQRKGVSPDTPSHIIQKHYEFYLANKIKSYRYMILFNLAYSVDVSFHCATLKHYEFYLANKIKSYRYVDYIQYGLFCLHSYCATLQVRSLRSQ